MSRIDVKRSVPLSAYGPLLAFAPKASHIKRVNEDIWPTHGSSSPMDFCSADESILRQLGELRDWITKAGDLTRLLALAYLTELRIVFRLRGVW